MRRLRIKMATDRQKWDSFVAAPHAKEWISLRHSIVICQYMMQMWGLTFCSLVSLTRNVIATLQWRSTWYPNILQRHVVTIDGCSHLQRLFTLIWRRPCTWQVLWIFTCSLLGMDVRQHTMVDFVCAWGACSSEKTNEGSQQQNLESWRVAF